MQIETVKSFMLPANRSKIYRTKTGAKVKISLFRAFDEAGLITADGIKNMKFLDPEVDKITHYPFLIIGDPMTVTVSQKLISELSGDNTAKELRLKAVPVCFYFENLNGWIYLEDNEWEQAIEETEENFLIPKVGNTYKMIRKKIKNELGAEYPAELLIPEGSSLFETEEDLLAFYKDTDETVNSSPFAKKVSPKQMSLRGWNLEFMILDLTKPFVTTKMDIDQMETMKRGGVMIQPAQIIAIGEERLGWLPLTMSRVRYAMELVQEAENSIQPNNLLLLVLE